MAAHIPGVTILPAVTGPAGRPGVGVAYLWYPRPGERTLSELIFNPATAGLLAEQTVTVNAATHTRTLTDWTVYLRTGVANSITSIPRTTTIP